MPEIYKSRITRSFGESLSRVKRAILPTAILKDSLAGWVMDFDALETEPSPTEFRQSERRDDRGTFVLMSAMGAALQQQIPLYFASLFCIGRQWRVSEIAIESLESASSRENILASIEATQGHLSRLKGKRAFLLVETPVESFVEAFHLIFDSGLEHHRAQLRQAQIWWHGWQSEVGNLKQTVDACIARSSDKGDDNAFIEIIRMVFKTYQPSPLQLSLEQGGVVFKEPQQRSISSRVQTSEPMLLTILAALTSSRDPYYFRDLERMFYYWSRTISDGPKIQIALERLRRKYGLQDPFEKYQSMAHSVSGELRKLVLENELPDESDSPWLMAWKQTLEEEPSSWEALRRRDLRSTSVLLSFARSADSTIKRHIRDTITPGELWNEFVQRLFEDEWISTILAQIAKANKESESLENLWTVDSFLELIKKVVSQLRTIGYSLDVPDENRWRDAWGKAHLEK